MIDHSAHDHPATSAARRRCRNNEEEQPRFFVQKDSYFRPCDDPGCAIYHKRYATERFDSDFTDSQGGRWVTAYTRQGQEKRIYARRWHEVEVTSWVILDRNDTDYAVDQRETKRAAEAEAARLNRNA